MESLALGTVNNGKLEKPTLKMAHKLVKEVRNAVELGWGQDLPRNVPTPLLCPLSKL